LIEAAMYETFYGFREKPFSLTPDPRYFYPSPCHANALELVQHASQLPGGLTIVTGTSGTGKTTTCRTILESIDRNTFTSLVLNPYVSEEDLLQLILQDFGVISRDEIRRGLLQGVKAIDLLRTLDEFFRSLTSLGARALLIVDEAQKLPLSVLEQIKRLSGLAQRAPLQVVLVGQLSLADRLRAPNLRALEQRVTIRYRLRPLTAGETAFYVRHRLSVAAEESAVTFTPKALQRVHRVTGGNPRLINLLCDRALLAGFSAQEPIIEPGIVDRAASGLRLEPAGGMADTLFGWMRRRVAAL
jgi:general secretion pathway protein A